MRECHPPEVPLIRVISDNGIYAKLRSAVICRQEGKGRALRVALMTSA